MEQDKVLGDAKKDKGKEVSKKNVKRTGLMTQQPKWVKTGVSVEGGTGLGLMRDCGKVGGGRNRSADEVEEGSPSQGWTRAGGKEGRGGEEEGWEDGDVVDSGKRAGRSGTEEEEISFA